MRATLPKLILLPGGIALTLVLGSGCGGSATTRERPSEGQAGEATDSTGGTASGAGGRVGRDGTGGVGSGSGGMGASGGTGRGGTGAGGRGGTTSAGDAGTSQAASSGGGAGGTVAEGGEAGNESGRAGAARGGSGGSNDSAGAGGGSAGSRGEIGTLGESCSPVGKLACSGNHQKLAIVCGGSGEWEINQTCEASEFCDSTPGANAGLCREPDTGCSGKMPNERFCRQADLMSCDADGLSSSVVQTCQVCRDAACQACSEGVLMDCTWDCGAPTENCRSACGAGSGLPAELLVEASEIEPGTRYELKLPPIRFLDPVCAERCSPYGSPYNAFVVRLPEVPGHPFYRIEMPSGWSAMLFNYPAGAAVCNGEWPATATEASSFFNCDIIDWSSKPEDVGFEKQLWLLAGELQELGSGSVTLEVGDEASLEPCYVW